MLRKMGIASDVGHVHPHKFRRTMATAAIDKGMPIEQVQRLLYIICDSFDTQLRLFCDSVGTDFCILPCYPLYIRSKYSRC